MPTEAIGATTDKPLDLTRCAASLRLDEGWITPLVASCVSCVEYHGGIQKTPITFNFRESIQEVSFSIGEYNPDERVGSLRGGESQAQRSIWKFDFLPVRTYGDESSDFSICRGASS
jgi:hypothetical protein